MPQTTPTPTLSPALLQQIHELADRFDAAWRTGSPPALESLLDDVPADARPELFRRLLRIELDQRAQRGRPLRLAEARQRFALFDPWAQIFDALGLVEDNLLTLEVVAGPSAGRSFELAGHSTFLVGRGPTGVQLALEGDPGMSRVHFLVEFNPPRARLADLRSKNGTFVNGAKVTEIELRDNDEVRAGTTTLRVRMPAGSHTVTVEGGDSPPTATPDGPPPPVLPIIPGYALQEEVGKGGMGVVYCARRRDDGVIVAVKTVLPAIAPRAETLARFQREVVILQRLTHPNIVRFLDSGSADGLLWFVMEFVEGTSASAEVKRHGPMAAPRVVALGCQLLDALAHAHLQGFIHRDVKPANILLTREQGRELLKLADFGLGRAYQESAMSGLTMSGAPGGTPGFMAPEQVTDFRSARPAADQFAVAATLYYLLTGTMLYEPAANAIDLFVNMMHADPIPLRQPSSGPALPGKLGEVVRRGLARDPRRRFPDVLAMREALHAAS